MGELRAGARAVVDGTRRRYVEWGEWGWWAHDAGVPVSRDERVLNALCSLGLICETDAAYRSGAATILAAWCVGADVGAPIEGVFNAMAATRGVDDG